jgi:hypothetical protein
MENKVNQQIFTHLIRALSVQHRESLTWQVIKKPMSPGERYRDQTKRYYNRIMEYLK